jgi:hypothetical protein
MKLTKDNNNNNHHNNNEILPIRSVKNEDMQLGHDDCRDVRSKIVIADFK